MTSAIALCSLQRRIRAPSYGAISDFSSYGPTIPLTFKPDIAAPGELIVRPAPDRLLAVIQRQKASCERPCEPEVTTWPAAV